MTTGRKLLQFDLLARSFRLLDIDPTATNERVQASYALAVKQGAVAAEILADARAAILDPARRLSCELNYPIDSTPAEIETLYAVLDGNTAGQNALQVADGLPPLSRAILVTHLAARRPAESPLLLALIKAHCSIDPAEIYTILKTLRNQAGHPLPSLVGVSEGLAGLLATHAETAIAGYDTVQDAAGPLLECAGHVLSTGERHGADVLACLLQAYRQSTAALRSDTRKHVGSACEALQRQPDNASMIGELTGTLHLWMLLSQPLILLDARQGRQDPDIEAIVEQVRLLLVNLGIHGHHETARNIANLALDVFVSIPSAAGQFGDAANMLQALSLEAAIKRLHETIEGVENDPGLIKALGKRGFGNKSIKPASDLWLAFCQTVEATKSSEFSARAWTLVREMALRLQTRSESTAASAIISGLIRHGEDTAVDAAVLDILRTDLNDLELQQRTASPTNRFSKLFNKKVLLAGSAALAMLVAFIVYRNLETGSFRLFASQPPEPEQEIVPPVGKGQHFTLTYVRWCHFQEERLRLVKLEVRGAEDVRAYNVLANDYNSRCSDFFYLDDDLKAVLEEMKAKKAILESDARRILSTWPWHAAPGEATPATK